jgi:DMSO reductase family type II enzyme chaperone
MITPTRDMALARSQVYGLLARALSHPDDDLLASLSDGSFADDLSAALAVFQTSEVSETSEVWKTWLAALREAAGREAPDLARQYLILFGPSYFTGQSPYETAYLEQQIFQKMQQMADIAGFYRAFGVEAASIERPDFLATELEFLHFLAYREAWARETGRVDGADICWNAQRSFLRDHLGRWAPLFCTRLAQEADAPVYATVGALAAAYVAYDAACLGVDLRPLGVAVVASMSQEQEGCGDCTVALRDREADDAAL